jgi:hypothetical protein
MACNDKSTQPCGCDEGSNHLCEWHLMEALVEASTSCVTDPPALSSSTVVASGARKPIDEKLNAQERKQRPLFSGVLRYFPDALLEVALCSFVGNEQHNPGEPLHWAKHKSTDEPDALVRHLLDAGKYDTDGVRHTAKVAWRALAMLQREIEADK